MLADGMSSVFFWRYHGVNDVFEQLVA